MSRDLIAHLAGFARALRDGGLAVGVSDAADGAAALTKVDLLDREEVRRALRTALKIRRERWEQFDALFDTAWLADDPAAAITSRPPRHGEHGPAVPRGAGAPQESPGAGAPGGVPAAGDLPGYSPEALLRRKAFDQYTAQDFVAMERLLARLSLRLATRPSRRLVPVRGRGVADLRRSFRRAVATRGDFVSLARRARAVEQPHLVLLCDTSGSMDPHTRFLLTFILSLKRVARRTEAFAFNTVLTRLTPWLAPGKIGVTLDRLAAGVPDWSGGTRIGGCLAAFVEGYEHTVLDRAAVVVILSDGLDRGEPGELVQALRAIRARARRVIWLNPLLGDARYEPTARGMQAALPYLDRLAPAHNLASLEALVTDLAA